MDKVLNVLGRVLIGAGIITFLFVGYQLWGTGIAEARGQDRLQNEAAQLFQAAPPVPKGVPNTTPAPPPAPDGAAVAVIRIPKINLEKAVVEGTGVPDLKNGPGHYKETPLPGQPGNAGIAGHRTTYGAPFGDIGELNNGDEINVTTRQGSFTYKVSRQQIVDPTAVEVLNKTKENRLTLTTCHPKYSAAKRLIVTATLVGEPAPAAPATAKQPPKASTTTSSTAANQPVVTQPPVTQAPQTLDASLSGEESSKLPAILWGLFAALIGAAVWVLGWVWKKVPAYVIGTPIFLVALFVFFESFSRLLPANA